SLTIESFACFSILIIFAPVPLFTGHFFKLNLLKFTESQKIHHYETILSLWLYFNFPFRYFCFSGNSLHQFSCKQRCIGRRLNNDNLCCRFTYSLRRTLFQSGHPLARRQHGYHLRSQYRRTAGANSTGSAYVPNYWFYERTSGGHWRINIWRAQRTGGYHWSDGLRCADVSGNPACQNRTRSYKGDCRTD